MRGGTTRAAGDLGAGLTVDHHLEDLRGTLDDEQQIRRGVVVEARDQPEPVAERTGEQARSGRGSHEGEARQFEGDRTGRRSLAQHDVDPEVLHCGVENLLDGPGQAVDLVDEQHVAVLEFGQDRGEVAAALHGRTRRRVDGGIHLGCHDARKGGLAQTGRAREQQVVGGLAPLAGRSQDDLEVALEFVLSDELAEIRRAETEAVLELLGRLVGHRPRCQQFLSHRRLALIGSPWLRRRRQTLQRLLEQRSRIVGVVG